MCMYVCTSKIDKKGSDHEFNIMTPSHLQVSIWPTTHQLISTLKH